MAVVIIYNIVGMAFALAMSTMHEKSCIDLHNAQKFEINLQNSFIYISRNRNDGNAKVESLRIS